ncbi:MAG: sulfite exporter TauE/SafE family protein [Bacteroidota bacterium]
MNDIAVLLIIGVLAGVMAGMFGIGGGVVMVPALIALMHYSLTQANGTSLAALMMPVGIFAVFAYHKKDLLDIRVSAFLAVGLLLGVLFGAKLALSMPTDILKQIYGLFLIWVSWRFFEIKSITNKSQNSDKTREENINKVEQEKILPFYLLLPFGILAGVLSGLFGIGGGLIIVPMLITFMKFNPKKAVGTSLGALLLPVALPGVITYYNAGQLHIFASGLLAAGLVLGSIIGAKITISLPVSIVKRVFALFLLIIALQFIISGF